MLGNERFLICATGTSHCFQIKYIEQHCFSPICFKYIFSFSHFYEYHKFLYLYHRHTKYFILFLYRPSFIFCVSLFSSLHLGDIFDGKGVPAHRYLLDSSILSWFDFFAVLSILLAQAACPFSFYLTFSIRYTYTHTANSSVSFRRIDGGTLYGATLIPRHRHVLSPLFSFPSRVSLRSFRSRETINTSL